MTIEVARPTEEFVHLSELLNRGIYSPEGERVGHLTDLGCASGEHFPRVLTYYLRPNWVSGLTLAVPAPAFVSICDEKLKLNVPLNDMQPSTRRLPGEILLRREILDKQIVDTDGVRVVRVNDIHLLRTRNNELHVVHVDIGMRGLLRRLGWEGAVSAFSRTLRIQRKFFGGDDRLISWRYVVPLRAGSLPFDLHLNVAQDQLAQLHPAELADILEEMDRFEGKAMIEALDVPTAAQTLAELSPKAQRLLLEALDVKRAAALVAAMPPDEEADLLEELPTGLRQALLDALPAGDKETVTELLEHEPDTAGSKMNPEVFTVSPPLKIIGVLELLRTHHEFMRPYAVPILDANRRLLGMIGAPDLLRADPARDVEEVMDADPVKFKPEDPMEEVAELFDRYNLLTAPVLDADGQLEGMVTVDDVVAWLREAGSGRGG